MATKRVWRDPAATAARIGREAARSGQSIHDCPYAKLHEAAAWRNGWSEERGRMREESEKEWTKFRERCDNPSELSPRIQNRRRRDGMGLGLAPGHQENRVEPLLKRRTRTDSYGKVQVMPEKPASELTEQQGQVT